ncbi:MAG: S8 family serine peptidase, partial [Gammaproteobacteria bacterium]|nr:S8 family serine peptidase [Gammaproteobacteria bacterium]
ERVVGQVRRASYCADLRSENSMYWGVPIPLPNRWQCNVSITPCRHSGGRWLLDPVVAIGNENHGNTSSPGNAHNAFSVGAVEKKPRGKADVAFFSSGASLVFPGQEPNSLVTKPDVVAPGVQVYSCIPPEKSGGKTYEYTYMDGSSMATPHVAGVAALLMAAKPNAPVDAILTVLKETARHPAGSDARPDNRWGFGLIRPMDALAAL